MRLECSLQSQQQYTTWPCPELDQTSSQLYILFKIHFNIITPLRLLLQVAYFLYVYSP
jgi:hypothetical protein